MNSNTKTEIDELCLQRRQDPAESNKTDRLNFKERQVAELFPRRRSTKREKKGLLSERRRKVV